MNCCKCSIEKSSKRPGIRIETLEIIAPNNAWMCMNCFNKEKQEILDEIRKKNAHA